MNCEVNCSSMYFIIKESFVKCGTSRGAFFFLPFSLVFSHINCLFLRLLIFVSFGGVMDSDIMYVFTFSAKET